MKPARVCVIDSSPTLRETITIVLGGDYEVRCLTPQEYLANPGAVADANLLIASADLPLLEPGKRPPDDVPILWLEQHAHGPLAGPGRSGTVSRQFTPEDLRSRVETLLTQVPPGRPTFTIWSIIDYPLLPREVTRLARRAAGTNFPVLICGEPGTGKTRLARALHASSRNSRFVSLSAAACSYATLKQAGNLGRGDLTVFVCDVGVLPPEGQHVLLELLDCGGFASDLGWHSTRLMCATARSFHDLARTEVLDKELFYRLSVLPMTLPPLRDRPHDIPALATYMAAELARLLSSEPVGFTQRALDRLMNYLWFGNLAELEAVLTRSVALTQGRTIDAEDLLFGYGRVLPHRPDAAVSSPVFSEPASDTVDLLINELAHEFKNPMVTIKTVAQHLERLLGNEAGREEVARLAGAAVDRMDQVLENLLQFTRFRTPAPRIVPLAALLAPCLSDLSPRLSERRVTLDYRPPDGVPVCVDAAQVVYAFENLLCAVARDLPDGETLRIRPMDPGNGLQFEFSGAGRPITTALAKLLDQASEDLDGVLPLGLVLAKRLIERNGGHLETGTNLQSVLITVWLPTREETAGGNGKATNLSS